MLRAARITFGGMRAVGILAGRWLPALPLAAALAASAAAGYAGLNGQDAHDYLRLARGYTAWLHGGARPVMVEHPHGLPLLAAIIGASGIGELAALRLISAAGLLAVLLAFRDALLRQCRDPLVTNGFLLLAFGLSPFLLRQSLTVMSDVPAIGCGAFAYACALRWHDGRGWRWLLLAFALLAIGSAFRLAIAPVIAVFACWVVREALGWRRAGRMAMLAALVAALIGMLCWPSILHAYARLPMEHWSPANLLRSAHLSDDGVLAYALPNLAYVLSVPVHPGFVPIGALLLPFFRLKDLASPGAVLALSIFMVYALFVGCMPYQNDRVLLLAQPFAAAVLFPAFLRAWGWLAAKGWIPFAFAASLLGQGLLFLRAVVPFVQQAANERELCGLVCAKEQGVVYTHGLGAAFSTYCPRTTVHELWSLPPGPYAKGALFVVNPANLDAQWRGMRPWVHWRRAQAQGVVALARRDDGWVVAQVR